eukprot:TRINITY_DN3138_c0_g1_i6.p1 TRINITY_DN3138_c0_g1~~TRINITY_DN3138_c0_g1_i6.p1  ORF type:complete len:534 (+),score=57.03 TRINITY_DN3138_c0_g1_i6:116-1603(+)
MFTTNSLVIILLLLALTNAQGNCPEPCHDIRPTDYDIPCDFYVIQNQCSDDIMKIDGVFVYCFCSCGRCVEGADVPPIPASRVTSTAGNSAIIQGQATSTQQMVTTIKQAIASATTILLSDDVQNARDVEKIDKVVAAASSTTQVVSTAIAEAFAATSLSAITSGENSIARGQASAVAESIANATATAYSESLAVAGDDQVFLQAETMATDIKTTLVSSYSQLEIQGDMIAGASMKFYGRAVAEVVAEATASAYSKIAGADEQAVGRAVAQALKFDELECPPSCNDNSPPDSEFTCQEYKDQGNCFDFFMDGYCECTCEKCQSLQEMGIGSSFQSMTKPPEEPLAGQGDDDSKLIDSLIQNQVEQSIEALVALLQGSSTVDIIQNVFQAGEEGGTSCDTFNAVIKGCIKQVGDSPKLKTVVKQTKIIVDCLTKGVGECMEFTVGDTPCCGGQSFPEQCDCTRMGCRSFLKKGASLPEIGLAIYNTYRGDCYCSLK